MAERKYDLALVKTVTDKKIRPQEWYKERLKTKFIKSLKPTDTSKHLVGRNWLFVKDGLDDFRDGYPPPVEGDIILKGSKGPGPNIKGSGDNLNSVKQPAVRKRFTKHQMCYSRQTPLQQQMRDHIDEVEYGLTQHPLALYPHFEENCPPDLFDMIVDLLDPEINMMSEEGSERDEFDDEIAEEDEDERKSNKSDEDNKSVRDDIEKEMENFGGEKIPKHPYRWKDKKDKKKGGDVKSTQVESQSEHIKKVTKEFCDWVANLGGESNKNNMEESTITSLFASGYETKPALSVPIHVVELTNVPQELRATANVAQQQQATKSIPTEKKSPDKWKYSGNYEPTWVKFKYGSWYLDPKTWKKRDTDILLLDPKEVKNQEMSESKKKSKELNNDIAQSHGAKLFMDWTVDVKRDKRKPEFLDEVAEIQTKAAEEEKKRLEAELAAKQKKTFFRKKSQVEAS